MENTETGAQTAHSQAPETAELELLELEEHAKQHPAKEPPRAKQYAFRVDKTRVVVRVPVITGAEILAKVDKTPEKFKLYQHKRGQQPIQIEPTQKVNLREPGVERFTTMPKDTTEGLIGSAKRQDFRLPVADEDYLAGLGLEWETIAEGGSRWLVVYGWVVPKGYNHSAVALALLIPDSYSDTQIDMVYFREHLSRLDGKPIGGLSSQTICGTNWQRWSRHRTSTNPWRIGVDDVATHLTLVDEWLTREFAAKL